MSSVYPYQIWLLFTILIEGPVQTLGETYNEVLIECLNNARDVHLCHGYSGVTKTNSGIVLKNCHILAIENCDILLRAKALPRYEDWWDPQILLTVAFNFRGHSIDKELHIEFGFQSNLTDVVSIGIHGVKSQSGQFEVYLVQYNASGAVSSQTFPQVNGKNGIELSAGNTTIVLSYILPSKRISADGLNAYAYHLFDHAYIMAAHDEEPLERWLLPEAHKVEILHHPGYAYVDCGERTTRCFTLTKTCKHDCLKTSSCRSLVKIGFRPDNLVTLYIGRRVGQKSVYVSAGVSYDASMSDDLVFDCMKELSGRSMAQYSYNDGHQNVRSTLVGNFLSSHRVNELNILECLWSIPYYDIYQTQGIAVDFSNYAYHILIAMGGITKSNDQLTGAWHKQKHTMKGVTSTRLNIKPNGIIDIVVKSKIPGLCLFSVPTSLFAGTVNGSTLPPTTRTGLRKKNFMYISTLIGVLALFGILFPSICFAINGFGKRKKTKHRKTRRGHAYREPYFTAKLCQRGNAVHSKAAYTKRIPSVQDGSKMGSKSSGLTKKVHRTKATRAGVSRNMRSFSSPSGPSHISLSSEIGKDPDTKVQSYQ